MNVLITLTTVGMIAMFGNIFKFRNLVAPLCVMGLVGALFFDAQLWNSNVPLFNNMMQTDNYAVAFIGVCTIGAMLMIIFYRLFDSGEEKHFAEVNALIIFSLAGVVVMVSFTNLLMLFLGIEILSLSLYILAGLRKRDLLSNEAAIKYFLMGAFSTGFLLFGIALLYGAYGTFNTSDIAYQSGFGGMDNTMTVMGILLIMVGLLFKVAAFPFQFWTPDVYQGAPTLVTAYMATVGKIAAFAAFLRLFLLSFSNAHDNYVDVLWTVAVATMLFGNITAIFQKSIKRMLAYSSIAHAGYMMIALVALNSLSANAVLVYSIAYMLASMSAFVLVHIIQQKRGGDEVTAFNGLAKTNPVLAFVLAVSMLSLAGIPPAAGFFAKFYIFSAAIQGGWIWLVIIGVISSFISVYYYFRPMIAAYMHPTHEEKITVSVSVQTVLLILALLTLLAGILPAFFSSVI